jgi:hypothetical protein
VRRFPDRHHVVARGNQLRHGRRRSGLRPVGGQQQLRSNLDRRGQCERCKHSASGTDARNLASRQRVSTRMISALLFTLAMSSAPCTAADLAHDARALALMRPLLQRSRHGFGAEEAAFLVQMPGGNLVSIEWPGGGDADGGRWEGAFPAGTIAIIHTHPAWLPLPSHIDEATARSCRVPVYVLTTNGIARAACGESAVVVEGTWE